MKTGMLLIALMIIGWDISAQGLENIIVERYYVSDAADSIASGGQLPVGSVTYRIFADLKKGYRFQAAYGIPGHPMEISTTTTFYNNEEFGGITANTILKKNTYTSTTILDSYLSVVAGSDGNYAVLKSADTTRGINNLMNALKNADKSAGLPLTVSDGLQAASPLAEVVFYGIDSSMLNVFRFNQRVIPQKFETENGSWACLLGSAGLDSTNCVLIAQLTTNGKLSFKLNIQVGGPYGEVENYVAENPTGNEKCVAFLKYPQLEWDERKVTGKNKMSN